MDISTKTWSNYRDKQKEIRTKAASLMAEWIEQNGIDNRDAMLSYANSLVNRYGSAAGAYACELYDELATAQGRTVPSAVPANISSFGEIAKAINGCLKQSADGMLISSVVERLTKQVDADTMLKNAVRDGAEWAWVPHSGTCAFCITLASRGWQRASKNVVKGGHAQHIHANCDCEFVVRFDGKSKVNGYDPEKYYNTYINAADGGGNARINALRREYYKTHKEEINAQKRAAYELRNNKE